MDAQELLVHERRQRKAVERVHARVVNLLGVLDFTWRHQTRGVTPERSSTTPNNPPPDPVLTFLLEREIFRQMSTFMVSTE